MPEATELTVQGQSLQSLYTQYTNDTFVVNRRYQRKLVWAVEEKERLIDSIVQQLPIPLILLAEYQLSSHPGFEIIDGLQRLNAIFSFLENEFPCGDGYFDLETLADTKFLRDEGKLIQLEPVLPRDVCRDLVNYQLPVSIYRSATEASVDEVFRRINSSGRKLSLQEIRQAGVTSDLASLVRYLSAAVRGDATLTDLLALREMPQISITSRDLPYGILDENIFWVRNGILERDAVRESRDEELVLDLLLDMVIEPMPVSGSEYRNSAYGRDTNATTSADVVAARIRTLGVESIKERFIATLDLIKQTIDASGTPWASWVITQQNPRGIPRYFHAIFVALYELQFSDNMAVDDVPGLTRELKNFWDRDLTIAGGGGNWGSNRKRPLFDAIKAQLKPFFKVQNDPVSVRTRATATQFEIELQMALTEASLFELKQGFTRLDGTGTLDEDAFDKVLRTASAMANSGPGAEGHIFFGVADKPADVSRVKQLYKIEGLVVNNFVVTGTRHELTALGRSVDDHLRWLTQRITTSKLEKNFANALASSLTVFEYNGYLIWSLQPKAGGQATSWDGQFYVRQGNSTIAVHGAEVVEVVTRFSQA